MASTIFSDCSSTTAVRLLPFLHFNPNKLHIHTQRHVSSTPIKVSMSTEATAKVIDGKLISKQIREEVKSEISRMKDATGVVPGLAVILVGDRKDFATYREDATVSIIHSRTENPEEMTRNADIIIAVVGQPNMVKGSWIKPGAVIIDVGINLVDDPESPRGYRLVGDVCYEEACKVASAISPVPGGVGPMTIAMLLSNTLSSSKRAYNFV
ncbi:hypothetical protein IFM89_014842 [Coptis chinensis]|uniref:methenyltetrahydrofolate cyclohydrolase n=1 Tax=Coptis chinensis TaxID=261450 RepID=A0A835IC48_9MAGN|nr:hypothetical protein IFM89_014842 [Coptis chinensis]